METAIGVARAARDLKSFANSERFFTSDVVSDEFLISLPVSEEFLTFLPVISCVAASRTGAASDEPPTSFWTEFVTGMAARRWKY